MFLGLVRGYDGRAAGRCQNANPLARARYTGAGKKVRCLQQAIEPVNRNGACPGNGGIERLAGANHRTRMRHRRFTAKLTDTHLIDQQRLAAIIGFLRRLDKAVPVLHAFQQADNHLGARIIGEEGNIIANIDIAGIP